MQWFTEHVTDGLLAIVMGLMAFFGKRALDKIDRLDQRKVDKDDMASLLKQLERHIDDDRELRREVSRRFDEFGASLSEVRVNVAEIVGRLERP